MDAELIEGSLRKVAFERKIPLLVFEGGEALRYDDVCVRIALDGILSVMSFLGMISPKKKSKRGKSYTARGSYWIRAPHSGIVRVKTKLGSIVHRGEELGVISDPLGNDSSRVKANKRGIIIGMTQLPLANRGDALFHVATFDKIDSVKTSILKLEDRFDNAE